MRTTLLSLAAVALFSACGGGNTGTPDAGPDTSCGIDCDAQRYFGLIAGNCFEYSSTGTAESPPALGALVNPVTNLEGGVPVIQVTYKTGGLTKMEDSFTFKNGDLYLVRRSWQPGQSVTFKDEAGNLTGVLWARQTSVAGETLTTATQADFINSGARSTVATTYTVNTTAPQATELNTPSEVYASGLRLLFSESPSHGADTRRVLVNGKGFVFFATPLDPTATQASEYKLQTLKQLPAGSVECGI